MSRKKAPPWPEGYTLPAWLPDWQDEASYDRLRSRVVYSYATITDRPDSIVDQDAEIYEIDSFRRLKPGSLKQETINVVKQEFAWEFLRRNPLYQADYQRLAELAQAEGVAELYLSSTGFNIQAKGQAIPPPSITFYADLYQTLTRWGLLYRLPDPVYTLHEVGPLAGITRIGNDCYLSQKTCEVGGEAIPLDGGIVLTDTETLWVFDVSLPIRPQLDKAKCFLEGASRRSRHGNKTQRSNTEIKKYLTYLRILDADASGADGSRIATVLYPDKCPSEYRNYSPHRDALNHDRLPAYELRDRLYRLLL